MRQSIEQMFNLTGKVVLIIGGARDLGLEMATVLSQAGASVVITSRSLIRAQESAESLEKETHHEVLPLALDLNDVDAIEAIVEKARHWRGRIDIFINNAGGAPSDGSRSALQTYSDASRTFDTRKTGQHTLCLPTRRQSHDRPRAW